MSDEKRKRLGLTLLLCGALLLLCLFLFLRFGYRLLQENVEVLFEPPQTTTAVSDLQSSITIPGFTKMTFSSASPIVQTDLYNPEGNACYFEISLLLEDTQEILYQSRFVAPGQHLYEIELTRVLEPGTYSALIHYSTYSMEDYTPLNGANVPFDLVVQ